MFLNHDRSKPTLFDVHAVPRAGEWLIDEPGDGGRRMLQVYEVHHLTLRPGKPDIAAELYCKEV